MLNWLTESDGDRAVAPISLIPKSASLWGEGSSTLAELAAPMGDDEIAEAAESRDTNGFYRVSVFGWRLRRIYIFCRHVRMGIRHQFCVGWHPNVRRIA